jgi:hypothetical protein
VITSAFPSIGAHSASGDLSSQEIRASRPTLRTRSSTICIRFLEAEARIAALTIGLDPGIGIMHADLKARDSLVCDLMEAVRPEVDAYVLDFLENRAFRKTDFFETREGVCRLMPSISLDLVRTLQGRSTALGPGAEFVAKQLLRETPT